MANNNTIKSQVVGTIQETLAPLTNAVAGSTATAFANNNGAVSGTGGGVIPLSMGNPGLYSGTGRAFRVRAFGTATGGASATTLTLTLYEVPASLLPIANTLAGQQTFTSWNSLKASSARTITALTVSWYIDGIFQLSATGRLEGVASITIADLNDVGAVTTLVSGLVGEADLNFAVVATMSSSQAANLCTMTEFSLEQV